MRQVKKTIWLVDLRHSFRPAIKANEFRVRKLKNSTRFKAGKYISEVETNSLIGQGWDVIIEEKK